MPVMNGIMGEVIKDKSSDDEYEDEEYMDHNDIENHTHSSHSNSHRSFKDDYDNDDNSDNVEGQALVSTFSGYNKLRRNDSDDFGGSGDYEDHHLGDCINWRFVASLVLFIMFASTVVVAMLPSHHTKHHKQKYNEIEHVEEALEKSRKVTYECPALSEIGKAANYDNTTALQGYIDKSKVIAGNVTKYLENFRDADFDSWGQSYNKVKAGMYQWKAKHFPTNLKNGDTIFESACGIGLNLIMTLEIIKDITTNANMTKLLDMKTAPSWGEEGIQNLVVYGNEYVKESADAANEVLDHLLPNLNNAKKGSVCTADSTDLHFIPANSFDLVFTGYISTLIDPLNFENNTNLGIDHAYDEFYEKLCNEQKSDWKSAKLVQLAQEKQNDWYGKWVNEMIRIAKPGVPVIIEQVSLPFCDAVFDWGGVQREFWHNGVNNYKWDVDPESIEMDDDKVFRRRYHVFMRKNVHNDDDDSDEYYDKYDNEEFWKENDP